MYHLIECALHWCFPLENTVGLRSFIWSDNYIGVAASDSLKTKATSYKNMAQRREQISPATGSTALVVSESLGPVNTCRGNMDSTATQSRAITPSSHVQATGGGHKMTGQNRELSARCDNNSSPVSIASYHRLRHRHPATAWPLMCITVSTVLSIIIFYCTFVYHFELPAYREERQKRYQDKREIYYKAI